MLCLHCQEAAIQSPAPSFIPGVGKGLECVSDPQSPLLCALLTHTGVGRGRRFGDVLALAQSRVTWMCIPRPKSRKSFLHGLLYCSFCAQKHSRAGTDWSEEEGRSGRDGCFTKHLVLLLLLT